METPATTKAMATPRTHDAAFDADLLVFEDEGEIPAVAGRRTEWGRMLDARAQDADVDDDDLVRPKPAGDGERQLNALNAAIPGHGMKK